MPVPTGTTDTFPKLLLHHARERGGKPAIREKDLGIWQSWTWREVRDEIEALAAGLERSGLTRGAHIAVNINATRAMSIRRKMAVMPGSVLKGLRHGFLYTTICANYPGRSVGFRHAMVARRTLLSATDTSAVSRRMPCVIRIQPVTRASSDRS